MAANKGTPKQNVLEEKLKQEVDKLKLTTELLALKVSGSKDYHNNANVNLKNAQKENSQLKQHCSQLVENMEQVTMSIVTAMKAYQSESRATLFSLQTQLQNKEKQLEDANEVIRQLNEKIEELKSQSGANQLMFEVHLQAIHVNYVNILEGVFEKMQQNINDDLNILEKDGLNLYAQYKETFKMLGLQCTFHDL